MPDYRLHCFAQSGNAYKVALALELAAQDWEPVYVDFFNGAARTAEYLAINEMGEVPVLEHAGLKLSQSGMILDYLSKVLGRFEPETEEERREILRWTLWDNHKLTSNIATLRFMLNFIPPEKRKEDVIGFLHGRVESAMNVLERHLEGRDWIAGPHITTADLSCIGYLYYTDEFGVEMSEFPNIDRWRQTIAALPRWKHPYELMPGHPLPQKA
ncbi:glutathione S-transferase family protein [Amaricoccus macauensis]|uniref:glutathione S-transferase family protein n=1 Tax=Amaricoccus macauensis TaxID=57001 RepID=UPI003C7AE53B